MSLGQFLAVLGFFMFTATVAAVNYWRARRQARVQAATGQGLLPPPEHRPAHPPSGSEADLMNALRIVNETQGPADVRVGIYRVTRGADGKTNVQANPANYIAPMPSAPPLSGMSPGSRGS